MLRQFLHLLFLCIALMVSLLPLRVQAALPKELPAAPAKFLTGACLTRSEDLWVTAEAGGVYRLSGQEMKPKWEDMRKQPGFPKTDNCTAVCEDSLGRIWVGTSNMGVQVFHKGQWKRYDRDTVLGGSHVHALASTSTGLTAVAHEQGVSLYNSHDDSWRDFTVLNGLPAGGVRAICFGSGDSLHCAMENGGYVRIDVRGTGRSAQRLSAPETWGKNRAVFYPLSTTGQGLCSNFCNGVSVGSLGQVCIASLNGISYSTTGGFRFLQGSDLKAKMDGAARKELIEGERKLFRESSAALKESYVNYVLYGKNGLWIGYRGKGIELRDPTNPQRIKEIKDAPKIKRPVRAVVEMPDGRVFCATYGAGLVEVCRGVAFAAPSRRRTTIADHPSYKRNDPVSVLQELRKRDSQAKPMPECWARFIGEDWCTTGDWCGHYGARRNVLCAANAPTGDSGRSNDSITINGGIGPHRQKGDSMRRWVEWVKADQNRNVLFKMEYCYRTEAEWDDHGETYPRTFEGPGLWLPLILDPEAVWRLALYFYNPNGRTSDNHERDYVLEVYKSEQGESLNKCMSKKPLCTARVSDFASNGVYKVFALHGAGCYRVRILRNGSLNTILNGIFLDHLYEPQDLSQTTETPRIAEQGRFRAPRWYDCGTDKLTGLAGEYARRYLAASETAAGIATLPLLRLEFYRHVRTRVPSNKVLAERLRWDAAIWTDADRKEFDAAMKEYWAELQEKYPDRRSAVYCRNSPGVTPLDLWELELMDKLDIDWQPYRKGESKKPELPIERLKEKLAKEKG